MERLNPTEIFCIGDYKLESLRQSCHDIKRGDYISLCDVAFDLSDRIPKDEDIVLVPIPSRLGYTNILAKMIGYYSKVRVHYCLQRREYAETLYSLKKNGCKVTEEDAGIYLDGDVPDGRIVLVDNVIATGTTMSAAIRAIGKPCDAVCIAVDNEIYNAENGN